jgi:hypothetical protein
LNWFLMQKMHPNGMIFDGGMKPKGMDTKPKERTQRAITRAIKT